MEIIFRDKMGVFDNPQPPVPDGAAIILLQYGEALVGQWDASIGGFIHRSNQLELAQGALDAILASDAEIELTSNKLRTFLCPSEIASRFDWDWIK